MDFDSYYSLLHAFDMTGRCMFGAEWKGSEVRANPVDSIDEIVKRKAVIEERLLWLRKEDRRLQDEVEQNPTASEREQIGAESREIWEERDGLRRELNSLPEISDSALDDEALFQRRLSVELELKKAFRSGDLEIILYPGSIIDFSEFERWPKFTLSFSLSLVVPPVRYRFGPRRSPAYVRRAALQEWLERFPDAYAILGELSQNEKCRLWLRKLAKGPKSRNKDDYRIEAIERFEGLTARAFDLLWANDETVPSQWKKPGRKRIENP